MSNGGFFFLYLYKLVDTIVLYVQELRGLKHWCLSFLVMLLALFYFQTNKKIDLYVFINNINFFYSVISFSYSQGFICYYSQTCIEFGSLLVACDCGWLVADDVSLQLANQSFLICLGT